MGRGRAKAKQQKVARALKYSSHDTDLTALQRELGSGDGDDRAPASAADDGDLAEDDEYPDDDRWAPSR